MTAFTQGAGTSVDPFIITTGEQCAEFFNRMEEAIYCSLAADVDLLSWPHKVGLYQRAVLNGNGYSIKNYGANLAAGTGNGLFPGSNSYAEKPPGSISKTAFIDIDISGVSYLTRSNGNPVFTNCLFDFKGRASSKSLGTQGDIADNVTQCYVTYCVVVTHTNVNLSDFSSNVFLNSNCYSYVINGGTCSFSYDSDVTLGNVFSQLYLSLDSNIWTFDENNVPRLISPNTVIYEYAGITMVDLVAKSRDILLLHYEQGVALLKNKATKSDSNGNFSFQTTDPTPKLIVAFDNPGDALVLNKSYTLGEIIRPTTANGYRYQCTTAGNSGSVSPASTWPTATSITIGSAIFTPEHIAESVSYGPVTPVPVGTVMPYNLILNKAYAVNDYVKPVTPVGYRWRCIQQGMTGYIYPPEPWSTTDVMQVGTAQFTPEMMV